MIRNSRKAWLPPIVPPAVEWIPKNVRTPPGSEYDGYLSYEIAPHTRGVFEAWDDEFVREIFLCWATRNTKTTTMIALAIFAAANAPRPAVFGSCDEGSINRTIDEQIYPMLDACPALAGQVPPPGPRRGRSSIKLGRSRIRKAFGGSKSSVAGYPACYVFVSEMDKWPLKKSSEADTVRGIRQRAKGYPFTSKFLGESSPGELATSRIWAEVHAEATDHRQFWVPCPHCGEYQLLDFFKGVKWKKPASGRSDPILAEATAWYECQHCKGEIHNEHRPRMMQSGVWLSDGQSIDKEGRITGERKRSPYVAFGPLSSLYSLLVSGWGQIAADFLRCGHNREKLKDFRTSTLALPWDPAPVKVDPNLLGERLKVEEDAGLCPEWSIFLTEGIDVQEGAEVFYWTVCAWGPGGRGMVIDYGVCNGLDELRAHLSAPAYPHADGGRSLKPIFTLMDSGDGNVTETVYQLCRMLSRGGRRVLPCKGSSTSGFVEAISLSKLEDDGKPIDKKRKAYKGGVVLAIINTRRSQNWIQTILDDDHLTPPEPEFSLVIPSDFALDVEFLEQLTADAEIDGKWIKRGPNEYRDCVRYCWSATALITNHGQHWNALPPRQSAAAAPETAPSRRPGRKSFATAGGGRQWPGS